MLDKLPISGGLTKFSPHCWFFVPRFLSKQHENFQKKNNRALKDVPELNITVNICKLTEKATILKEHRVIFSIIFT
jgi:long-subunit acyl-CoA synthetase (AMP-forming)